MLELNHVTKKYIDNKSENIDALDDVNLVFPDTGLVVICGASGCGKTTMLNILGGLDRPTSGEVYLDNVRIDNKNEKWWDAFRGIGFGFIYQDFNLLENMSVRENVQLPLTLQNLDEEISKNKINEIIDELGLEGYLDKKTGKLSGGQKQRVAIARALVTGAKIILADEPTGNLDKQNSENVFRLLKNISKNRLVIVVTHDSLIASSYADRLIQIAYGKVERDNGIDESVGVSDIDILEKKQFVDDRLIKEVERRKLSLKECLKFAKEAISQRKMRCFVSVMIFSITMLFILLLCETVFRDDSIPVAKYINNRNQKIIPLYIGVPDAYVNIVEDEKIVSGKKFYDLICRCVDKSRIISCAGEIDVDYKTEIRMKNKGVFVSSENEKYFDYEGVFPREKNEIAISKTIVDKIGSTSDILGSCVIVGGKEYVITSIVMQVCGRNVEDVYVDDGKGDNLFENVIFFSEEALADKDRTDSLYMPGFGVTAFSSLFYQVTVYNEVCSVEGEMELIFGRMPKSDNEILISQEMVEFREQAVKDVVGNVYVLSNLYENKYGSSYWNMINLYDYMDGNITIVGVVKGRGDYYVTASLYDRIFHEYKGVCPRQNC